MKINFIQNSINSYNNSSLETNNDTKLSFGRKKVPRYIYHFTRRYKYEHILYDGYLKGNQKDAYIKDKAIFAVDLQNFVKNWGHDDAWNSKDFPEPLYQALLDKIGSKYDILPLWLSQFVILKIPTKLLDKTKLRIRSQKTFFEQLLAKDNNICNEEVKKHLSGEVLATESRKYNNKKEAIEYIYLDDIPIDKIEVLNDITPLMKEPILNYKNEYLNLLNNLLKDTPQQNEMKNFRT